MRPMDINIPDVSECSTPLITKNGVQLYPVQIGDSGEGWPYAPMNWPNPGDIWRWKAGKRLKPNGFIKDRYLYLPRHLLKKGGKPTKYPFASKPSVKQYVRSMFPGADINAFFDSFSWEIPSQQLSNSIGHKEGSMSSGGVEENSDSDALLGTVLCKAGNRTCSSLVEAGNTPSDFMSCDICCSEQNFCRYCCCILCCKVVSSAYGGYCYIRCEARTDEGYICGHIAHTDCGLRSFMAGTVGGSIGLDAEYYCRRCDSRTDLVQHVMKLVDMCQTIDSHDDIEKILTVGIFLLRNSHKASAQQLLHNLQAAIMKLKRGTKLENIWSNVNIPLVTAAGNSPNNGVSALRYESADMYISTKTEAQMTLDLKLDFRIESFKLEDDIDQVLLNLRKSQHCEYVLAEKRLLVQKNLIQSLYEQLEKERSELSRKVSHVDSTTLFEAVMKRVQQIKAELTKFNDMKEVANGFGRTSEQVLKNHFGVASE